MLDKLRAKILFISLLIIATIIEFGCANKPHQDKKLILQDESVYSVQNFSSINIDSNLILSLVAEYYTKDSFTSQILDFYKRRNYQTAWYTDSNLTTHGHSFAVRIRNYIETFSDSSILDWRLRIVGDSFELKPSFPYQLEEDLHIIDVLLTAVFFKYAKQEYYGTSMAIHDLEWYIPRKKKNYHQLLNTIIASNEDYAIYEPITPYYASLKKALLKYRKLENGGGFPVITDVSILSPEEYNSALVESLKTYLILTEDLSRENTSILFDASIIEALKKFQSRMGISANGILDKETIAALNIPINKRIQQIMVNMERLRWAPDSIPENYILVNIPEFKLHVFEQNKFLWSMNIIVGKDATVTSIFSDRLKYVVFCPYWKVPQSIIVNDILPKLKVNPGYLYSKNMEVRSNGVNLNPYSINWRKFNRYVPYEIRQKPGKNNALGQILFMFPNQFDIYMHDSPSRELFDAQYRAFSHGCIRLAEAGKLAKYVLRNDTAITDEKIKSWIDGGRERKIMLKPSLAVYIAYFTAWVDKEGKLNFRNDIYNLDKKLEKEIFAF